MLLTISATAWLPSLPGENRHDTTASAAPQESPCLPPSRPHPHRHCTGNLPEGAGAAPYTYARCGAIDEHVLSTEALLRPVAVYSMLSSPVRALCRQNVGTDICPTLSLKGNLL
jgi:hypothetical protein